MKESPVTERKAQITARLIDYLLTHGPGELSLRPMAAAVGTSARLLIFHYGSKEKLLLEVLHEIERQTRESLSALLAAPHPSNVAPLRAFWNWALKQDNLRRLRLIYEIQLLAARGTGVFASGVKEGSSRMVEMVKAALPPPLRTAAAATLFCAVFDGLFLELTLTGDVRRTTRSLDLFAQMARGMVANDRRFPAAARD